MKEQFLNLTGLTELVGYLKTSIANHKEILPYASNKLFPSTGDINAIYIDTATNIIYRWDESSKTYKILAQAVKSVSISESTENGKITLTVDGVKTTVPIHGLKSAAFTESSAYSPANHTHTKAQIGLGNVDNTADANKSVKYATSAGSSTTSGAISSSGTLDTVAKLDAFIEGGKVKYATVSALDGLNGMIKNDGICISTPWSSTGYGHQFYINDNGYEVYHRFRNTTKVNNVDTTTWSSWKQILDSSNYNLYAPTKTGSGASGTWGISVTGNAATATKLATARSINGTNFDGSGNIITATWGTARNVTIGSTKKSVNGGADVSWSLSEIGAAAASHSHSYLPLSGGTMSGTAMITWPDSGNWGNSNKNVTFPVIRGGLSWIGQSDGIQLYAVETQNDNLELYLKFTDDNSNGLSIRNKENTQTARISANGEITASKFVGKLTGNADSATKLANARKIGSASFDGTADITLSQMGLNVPVEITKADYLAKKKAGTLNANTYYNVIDEYDSANVINDSSVTANSAFSSTKSEKTYAKKSTLVTTTLTASKWTGSSAPYTYVLPVSGATTLNIIEINYASNASSQAIEAYQNAMLADGGQTTNQITIKATEKPTVDIPITIVIRNDL